MKRPLAYVTAAWRGGECEVMEQAAKYCRIVYDAGYSPICPMLYLPLFLNDAVPEEHKSGIDMGRDLLRRSRVLVVCGNYVNEAVKNDTMVELRNELAKEVKGYGLKEASHFLRNIGFGQKIAILDRHIMRVMDKLSILPEGMTPKTSLTKNNYLQ